MKEQLLMDDESFWPFLDYVSKLPKETSFEQISNDINLEVTKVHYYVNALKHMSKNVETYESRDKHFLKPIEWNDKINLEFTIPEWLKFQAHFPFIGMAADRPFHNDIFSKLAKLEMKHENYDLFKLMSMDGDLENLVDSKNLLLIKIQDKETVVYPRRILLLDGEINLIAENTNDKTLINVLTTEITHYEKVEGIWECVYSEVEVEDFISSLRLISESCMRLVLKVFNMDDFHVEVQNQYFEKPCLFTNLKGESIWAATVEPSEDLFEWVLSMGSNVEIIDPIEFKKDFLAYCENHLKKIA